MNSCGEWNDRWSLHIPWISTSTEPEAPYEHYHAEVDTRVYQQSHSLDIPPSPWYLNLTLIELEAESQGYESTIACPAHWPDPSIWPENHPLTFCLALPHYGYDFRPEYGPCATYLQNRLDRVEEQKRELEATLGMMKRDYQLGANEYFVGTRQANDAEIGAGDACEDGKYSERRERGGSSHIGLIGRYALWDPKHKRVYLCE